MKKSIFLALLAMMWLAVPVRALEPGNSTTQRAGAKAMRTATGSAVNPASENRCKQIESKIDFKLNFYKQNRDKHYQTFEHAKSGVQNLIEKYQNRGCDVTLLKTDAQKLESLIQAFAAAYRDFHSKLEGSEAYACGTSPSQFASSIQSARGKMTAVRQASTAVHTFYRQTLRPHFVEAAKNCKPSPRPTASPVAKGGN